MNFKASIISGLVLTIAFLFLACVNDVDFDQIDEFEATPVVNLDLVFFDLDQSNFIDETTQELIPVLRDTTQLEFLNDDFFRDNVTQVDFVFQYQNTFNTSFASRAVFLSPSGEEQLSFELGANPSIDGLPEVTVLEQTVIGDELLGIQNSIMLIIEIIPEGPVLPVEGILNFQSRAVYFLEFSDL